MKMYEFKKNHLLFWVLAIILPSLILINPQLNAQGQQITTPIESFNTNEHKIIVKLWKNDKQYQEVTVLPLSIARNLHSHWGNMAWGDDGLLYLPPATHSDLDASIWLVRYNPEKNLMEMMFEARKNFIKSIGNEGLWDSKIHTGITKGKNGKLYFAGMTGGSYATMYTHMVHPSGYLGGHVYEYDVYTGITTDLGIVHKFTSLIALDYDLEKNILYLLNWPQSQFIIFDLNTMETRNLGTVAYHPTGPNNRRLNWGRDIFVYKDHTVWTNNDLGCLVYYDPVKNDLIDTDIALPHNEALRKHVFGTGPTAGKVFGMTNGGWLFEFDPASKKLTELGSVLENGAYYSPNLAITPDGESLYYIAGSHGDEASGGMHIIRYDIQNRKRIDLGLIGREAIPAFYCYGATVHNGMIYFTLTGGDPSNTYLMICNPNDKTIHQGAK
jgi:hypothetical protein